MLFWRQWLTIWSFDWSSICLLINLEAGFYSSDNTHYYEPRLDFLSWGDSIEIAPELVFKCRKGHVATITRQSELDLITSKLSTQPFWISANQILPADAEPHYVWAAGPEAATEANWPSGGINVVLPCF